MVTAMPVTGVEGSPALKVSTVGVFQGTPTWDLICSMTPLAVRVWAAEAAAPARKRKPRYRSTETIVFDPAGGVEERGVG